MSKFFTKKKVSLAVAMMAMLALLLTGTLAMGGNHNAGGTGENTGEYIANIYVTPATNPNWKNGTEITKRIYAENKSTDNIFARVQLFESLTVNSNSALDKTSVLYQGTNINKIDWTGKQFQTVAAWDGTTENIWVLDTDGWLYWIGSIAPDAETLGSIVTTMKNDGITGKFTYTVDAVLDAVAADGELDEDGDGYALWTVTTSAISDYFDGLIGSPVTPPTPAGIVINAANFPDAVFRTYVATLDTDSSGGLDQAEIDAVKSITLTAQGLTNVKGVEFFTELTLFNVFNNNLNSIDISALTKLESLVAGSNNLTSLNTDSNVKLHTLRLGGNQITSLNLSTNTALTYLECPDNQLSTLNLASLTKLDDLRVANNQLTTLNLSTNVVLRQLRCNDNQLTALSLASNPNLITIRVDGNQISTLDISMTALFNPNGLQIQNNNMTSLTLGSHQTTVGSNSDFTDVGNPSLVITRLP
jgi:Leucine-rich repeat (LRR) protein